MMKKQNTASAKSKRFITNTIVHVILAVLAVIWVIPIAWIIMISFRGESGQYISTLIPKTFTLNNYKKLFTDTQILNFPQMFINTLIISIFSCVISTFFVLSVSYCMSRMRFKMRKPMMNIALVLGMFPGFMSMIAVYYILKSVGLSEGAMIRVALVLVYSGGAGLGFYIAKGFFDTIPKSIDEAAYLDGATRFQVFTKITIPLSKPIIVYTILQAFIEKDPGENGEGKTVGFVCDPELSGECGYSSEYLMDIVFAANGAYPKQWIEDENGEVSYGSVLPQAKDALAKLKSMYERNILDQNFLLRTSVNNIELITKGLCGSFFGPWWAANNPLMEAIAANPDAVWEPFLIQTDDDGSTSYYSQNPTYKYVVVRKGYEHPEIACKIINGLFDYVRYDGTYNSEFEEYYQNNVDPTARPLAINVDYSYALTKCYHELTDVLSGKKEPEDLDLLEYSYYRSCKAYLDNTDSATPEEWAAYTSRITACSLLADAKTNKVESLYFDETETMGTQWWKLRQMEKEYYLQIVTGERDIDAFDEFVTKWYENGGETITQEVREAVH